MQRRQYYLCYGVILMLLLSGCAPGVKQKPVTVEKSYEAGISDLSRSLEQNLSTAGKETVAIVDFTDSEGNLTDLSLAMTDDVAAALAATEKEFWIASGPYLRKLINRSAFAMNDLRENPEIAAKLWQTMGIETVITGTMAVQDENTIQLFDQNIRYGFPEGRRGLSTAPRGIYANHAGKNYRVPAAIKGSTRS